MGILLNMESEQSKALLRSLLPLLTWNNLGHALNTAALYHAWHTAEDEYILQDLTNGKDKLPALAGLANEFHDLIGGDYLAGLWNRFLPHGLLWYDGKESLTW